ncbi:MULTISPECIES: tagatose-bisphosphate aldolase subunit GatZ [Atlantibacter]|uniref:tagatose-bisphosphate aldolase subunit GatZ n=1 Tax=Atlantibacter TaxID=1903434 RepID=UPI0011CD9E1C|nr:MULTISPECIES: tagatose-bisphosphate aldolase subunit GatZ [Atlantibacter]MCQ4969273.1 tagatose-bisphosphate aldolase subunit GatZ [Enterobacteriaceae bacterium DFI.7.85]MDQ7883110.1 tagatose-bisphosphate aldolase subunit GatZ [Atlantibacter hermannii]MDU7389720.1 tagatose-bisphosphate aldolase subunit GatZ [Atlantibacter hermannii]MDW4576804.1 tagatose-bisphosphate aldolase subunit GatZ [Atlantibacter hermannii]
MKDIIHKHKSGLPVGICSVCSAHPLVIEAALLFDLQTERKVLIEATSNQVNQFGGYTGMKPDQFRDFVLAIADKVGFPHARLILGGDHLGPNCWQGEDAESALLKSEVLIEQYVRAGFTKIHIDTSMSCADDPVPLLPVTVAQRAARLCQVAERVATDEQKQHITYVVGTEVPVPGGEKEAIKSVHITTPEAAMETIQTHYDAFAKLDLHDAIERIIAIVVQPGVEFDHSSIVHYQPELARDLTKAIESTSLVYEAHSTDYQTAEAYKALVRDHFAILKVGPALTFALREAMFALAMIENTLVAPGKRSELVSVIDSVMQDEPGYWKNYYSTLHSKAMIDLHFSLSDRLRYYWPHPTINSAVNTLFANLEKVSLPLGVVSQYFPEQFQRINAKQIPLTPKNLVLFRIQDVLRLYAFGCDPQ